MHALRGLHCQNNWKETLENILIMSVPEMDHAMLLMEEVAQRANSRKNPNDGTLLKKKITCKFKQPIFLKIIKFWNVVFQTTTIKFTLKFLISFL